MSRWFDHAGDRVYFLRVAGLLTAFCTVIAFVLALAMLKQDRIGLGGLVGIVLLGQLVAAVLSGLVWVGVGATSRALVTTMTGAGNLKAAPSYSYQESLVARGRFEEAERAYQDHLATEPDDLDARLALAALVRDQLRDPARAERLFLEARALGPTPAQEYAIANALIDLYHRTRQSGREMAELARFADRYRGTDGGNRARDALRRLKSAKEIECVPGWRYFSSRQIREARAWAAAGGLAVHENLWKSRGRRTCHLLARGEPELLAAARLVGCEDWWIQRTRTAHFDLVEIYLERALRRCGATESLTGR